MNSRFVFARGVGRGLLPDRRRAQSVGKLRAVAAVGIMLAGHTASAQRGIPETAEAAAPPPLVRELPDAFNTTVLSPRRWAIDSVSGEVLYGLERRMTVGLRAPYTIGAGLGGLFLIGGSMRYRVFDAGPWSASFSLSGTYGVFDRAKGTGLKHLSIDATLAYQRTSAHMLALSAYGGDFKLVTLGTGVGADWRMLMATSTHYPVPWFGYQLGVGWMQSLEAQVADTKITAPAPVAFRTAMTFVYRKKLLFSLGLTGAFTTSGQPLPVPFFNVQRHL